MQKYNFNHQKKNELSPNLNRMKRNEYEIVIKKIKQEQIGKCIKSYQEIREAELLNLDW